MNYLKYSDSKNYKISERIEYFKYLTKLFKYLTKLMV